MIKKLLAVFTVTTMVLAGLSGCAKKAEQAADVKQSVNQVQADSGKALKVVTTIFPPYDFVKNIGKEKVEVSALVKPGAEIHSFEPTPSDIKLVSEADLFIYTGGENDVWVEDILSSMDKAPAKILKMTDSVDTLNEVIVEGMEHEHEGHDHDDHDHEGHEHEGHEQEGHEHEGHEHEEHEHESHNHEGHEHEEHEMDEHVWTSPKNAIKIAHSITGLLKELSPENADFFEQNYKAYSEELEKLDTDLTKLVSESAKKTIVVADRFPFLYLAKHYGITYYAAFSGCSTDTEAKPTTITFLINKVKEEGIKMIFKIEMSDSKLADAVAEATGARVEILHSAHNLSKEEIDKGITYVSLMQRNIELLREALNY